MAIWFRFSSFARIRTKSQNVPDVLRWGSYNGYKYSIMFLREHISSATHVFCVDYIVTPMELGTLFTCNMQKRRLGVKLKLVIVLHFTQPPWKRHARLFYNAAAAVSIALSTATIETCIFPTFFVALTKVYKILRIIFWLAMITQYTVVITFRYLVASCWPCERMFSFQK